jgi:hypothetical protein
MLLLDEEATYDDAAPTGGRREREGCIALGSGTLGWWCTIIRKSLEHTLDGALSHAAQMYK